ncbi:MAG: hypothetical protein U0324_46350 [Polyangiales bacterium]
MPRAGVNTRNKRLRAAMAEGCGPSPLCKPCGFSKKPVRTEWRVMPPGTPYTCDDPQVGKLVTLRGDTAPSVVVGCATPMGPGLLQMGRVSKRYECQGALVLRTPLGLHVLVPRSVVVERQRLQRPGRAVCSCTGLPWPHREASSPLCERHPSNPAALAELERAAYEGGERDEARFMAAASRAKPRARVETMDDARRVLAALLNEQREAYDAADKRRAAPRSEYQKRVSAARREARAEGWDV